MFNNNHNFSTSNCRWIRFGNLHWTYRVIGMQMQQGWLLSDTARARRAHTHVLPWSELAPRVNAQFRATGAHLPSPVQLSLLTITIQFAVSAWECQLAPYRKQQSFTAYLCFRLFPICIRRLSGLMSASSQHQLCSRKWPDEHARHFIRVLRSRETNRW